MKTILVILLILFSTNLSYSRGNCAKDKNPEFRELLEQLEEIDLELATEATNAYGIVSSFETFDDKEPRCFHIDRLLETMKSTIELYK